MLTLNEALKIAGLPQRTDEAKVTVTVPFNNYESEFANLRKAGLELRDYQTGEKPHPNARGLGIAGQGGGGNTEVKIHGEEKAIRNYLANLWNLDPDSDEINELF